MTIFAPAGCSRKPEVQAVKVSRTTVELTVTSVTSGTVNAEKEAQLSFGAVGRVSQLNVNIGSVVKKGELLAEIENADLKSAMSQSQEDLKRALRLNRSDTMPPQEAEHARESADIAKGAYEKSIIFAPFDGMITELNLEIGQLSQITAVVPKALIRIVDMIPRYVSTDIDEVDLPRIKVGLPARIKILAVRREPFRGTVRLVIPFVSTAREQDRTSRIELSLEDEGILLPPGASADVEVIAEQHAEVLAIPSRAILGRGNERFVYKVDNGRVQKTPVSVGIGNYERTEILSGLGEGDTVLIPSEKVTLKEGLAVNAQVTQWR